MNEAGMTSASYPFPSPSHTSETATGPKVYGNPPPLNAKWRCKQAMWLSLSHVGLFCGIGIVNLRQMA